MRSHQPADEMITACANLRVRCAQIGHAPGDNLHDGDRRITAAAVRLSVPLVSRDGLFDGAPGFELISAIGDE